jgi:N-methylhydantoinase B
MGMAARYRLERGEVVSIVTGTGGGWGDPRERPPDAVLADVLDGYVSVEQAAADYGVAIDSETLELRKEL